MCGILVAYSKVGAVDYDLCNQALAKLNSRGPDFSYTRKYLNHRLFLGGTVLSITGNPTDAIDHYHTSLSKHFGIVFNGEIYNYRELFDHYLKGEGYPFKSQVDTEVLVNLHELQSPTEVYKKLRGMFAYVLYDSRAEKLIIGRDVIGEKILYSYEDDEIFIISSEIGPILALEPSIKINRDVLREYFFTRHLLTPEDTQFVGIKLIQPGHLLEYDLNQNSLKTLFVKVLADFINPAILDKNKRRRLEDLVDEYESILDLNAKTLRPSSVPYSSILSGGIDSSIMSSVFAVNGHPPKRFVALQFPGKDKISENLERFETKLNCSIAKTKVDVDLFASFFDVCYQTVCGPLPTHSCVSQAIMSKSVRNQGIKVLIGGDGGDELMGGYEFYKSLRSYTQYPDTNPSIYSGVQQYGIKFENWNPQALAHKVEKRWKKFSAYYEFEQNPRERMVQTVLYSDVVIQLESVGIRVADTMNMLNAVEGRGFYLTQEIVSFALNLPAFYKIDLDSQDEAMVTRPFLKKVFCRKFGSDLLFQKQGFSGYPNEAGHSLIEGGYPLVTSILGLRNLPPMEVDAQRAVEWKLMNVELFLRRFSGHI